MKCRICGKKAIVRTISGYYCEKHFTEYYENRVEGTIKRFNMFTKKDNVLVAVSGGKDSMALTMALNNLGYKIEGLFIDLNIGDFSKESSEKVKKLYKELGLELNLIDIKEYGVKVQRVGPRPPCSVCGIIKRYLMNKFAYENGFDVIVTGHNLDDEASFFLSNLLGRKYDLLARQGPVSPPMEKMVKKAKPQYLLYEKENGLYSKIMGIDFVKRNCPFKIVPKTKVLLKKIEEIRPYFTYEFVLSMLGLIKKLPREEKVVRFCRICGYPTESKDGICSFCKLREYFKKSVSK